MDLSALQHPVYSSTAYFIGQRLFLLVIPFSSRRFFYVRTFLQLGLSACSFFLFFQKIPCRPKASRRRTDRSAPGTAVICRLVSRKPLRKRLLPSGTDRFRRVLSSGDHPVLFPLCFFCFSSSFFLSTTRNYGKISPNLFYFSAKGSEK